MPRLPPDGYRFRIRRNGADDARQQDDGGRQPDGGHRFGEVRALFRRCLVHRGRGMSLLVDKPANSPPEMLK